MIRNRLPPPPPPPGPPGPNPPQPSSEWNGNYSIVYPLDSIGNLNISDQAPYLNLTPNFLKNYLVIADDIGKKIGKDTYPILKCLILDKYVSVIFKFDPVNFIDFNTFYLRYDDTFYVNMQDPHLPKNSLIGGLFFDTVNNILSTVLTGNNFVVCNVKNKIFYFDIPENSYETM
jgi:hypothetical protein